MESSGGKEAAPRSSRCIPQPARALAIHQNYPESIVATPQGSLVWANTGTAGDPDRTGIFRTLRTGGSVDAVVAPPVALGPRGFALSGEWLYWANGTMLSPATSGTIGAVSLGGGAAALLDSTTREHVVAVVASNTYIYFADWATASVYRLPVAGGPSEPLIHTPPGPVSLAIDAEYIYFATNGRDTAFPGDPYGHGIVARARLDGTELTTLAREQRGPRSVKVDTSGVYWLTSGDFTTDHSKANGSLVRLRASDLTPSVLVSGVWGAAELALDDEAVYWTEADSVGRIAKLGGVATALAHGSSPRGGVFSGIALDDCYAYWTIWESDGTVMMVSK